MYNRDIEERLTDLAEHAIRDAVYNYREKIIKEAFSIAVQNNTEQEISLINVHDAVNNLQKRIEKKAVVEEELNERIKDSLKNLNTIKGKRKERRRQLLTSSMALIGIAYIIVGLSFYYEKLDHIFYDKGFIISIVGIAVVFSSLIMGFFSKHLMEDDEELRIESQRFNDLILQLWSQIDYYGKELWSDYLVDNASKMPKDEIGNINSSIDLINRLLNSEEKEKFSKLLEVRNKIVHGDDKAVHRQEKEEVILIADHIIDKLKGMVESENPKAAID